MKTDVWLVALAVLILLGAVVPYTLLTHVSAWYGAFLFWSVIGALIALVNVMFTRGWEDS